MCDGIFERYWAKPTKKKTIGDTPNPPRETMSKLGVCSMIIDPHLFEVTLFTVKDNPVNYTPVQPPALSTPQYNPFAQTGTYPQLIYNAQSPAMLQPYQCQQQSNLSKQPLPGFRDAFAQLDSQGAPPIYHAPLPATASTMASTPPKSSKTEGCSEGASQGQVVEPNQGQVIQMLATRAASDHGLKTLMKVVASGKASKVQLRDFQDHIDELTAILKARQSPASPFQIDDPPKAYPHGGQEYVSCSLDPMRAPDDFQGSAYASSHPAATTIKTEPSSLPCSVAASSAHTKAYTIHKPEVNAIVFDFGSGGDRFSIPRFSFLEYLYGGTQVLVSFLVIKSGSMAMSGKYQDTKSYYQPVTIRLSSPHPRILEPLARVVAPPDEVGRYMNSVFDKMSPAETAYLAIRLPRVPDASVLEKEPADQPESHVIRPFYSPPNSIMPLAA